jgi:hypothetical protein
VTINILQGTRKTTSPLYTRRGPTLKRMAAWLSVK